MLVLVNYFSIHNKTIKETMLKVRRKETNNTGESLAKKQFHPKSQVGVHVTGKMFQQFEVDSSLPVLNAGRFASAI